MSATEKAISDLDYFLSRARVKLFGVDGLVTEGLRVLAGESRAMADVRTLDDWAEKPGNGWRTHELYFHVDHWSSYLVEIAGPYVTPFKGATPDEARAKAAAWVREQK